ncbi:hypothetical protein BACCAP_01503 [Pseudoflavonifractor capillosus ATCC 29799]|uniref:Uncharacterized protein n=1 Tax=Pseudoflavonifractor capillosus ATCC 29799 TaxID=411467 RepID=A6NTH4_9FIRM|nr:hypothetical protein BACCAP_01503 [Pseudoflavonifractor capillosus ATCC 29799]
MYAAPLEIVNSLGKDKIFFHFPVVSLLLQLFFAKISEVSRPSLAFSENCVIIFVKYFYKTVIL